MELSRSKGGISPLQYQWKSPNRTVVFGLCVSDNAEPPTKPPPSSEEPCLNTAPVDQAGQPCGKDTHIHTHSFVQSASVILRFSISSESGVFQEQILDFCFPFRLALTAAVADRSWCTELWSELCDLMQLLIITMLTCHMNASLLQAWAF